MKTNSLLNIIKRFYFSFIQHGETFLVDHFYENNGNVLMFHNIKNNNNEFSISEDNFKKLVIDLLSSHKNITTINNIQKEDDYLITFDDVSENVYYKAYPFLKEKNIPFYIFVNLEFLNKPGYLNEEMIREMLADSKCVLGSHGSKHVLHRLYSQVEEINDLRNSKNTIEELFNVKVDCFAFPYGSKYACSKENIKQASLIYDYVFMAINTHYNIKKMSNIIPRKNLNDHSYRKVIKCQKYQ